VYQESCGDEIGELVEVFNQMVKDLRYNLSELNKVNTEKSRMERLSALGEMATTVAHETKNPLNSIRLATSYLKKNFQGEILSEFLEIIEQEVARLNELTTGFLGYSKPAPLKLKPCDINTVVRATVDLVRQDATDRNIELVVLMDDHAPPVGCDISQMKQALLNLLVNAMDASREGSAITVKTESADRRMRISVRDSGAGIPQGEIEKIFKPFYTTKTRGAGLGLAIVERIVKEHGGEIRVESAKGKGTTFTLELPVHAHA
jgi:signal transduction histidine kinase